MPINSAYQEIPGSKNTAILLQFISGCSLADVNQYLCSEHCPEAERINNPQ